MDKSKTLEVLRGMKFMQRKEEAKRRAMYEAGQKEALESRVHGSTATNGAFDSTTSKTASTGPTILFDKTFPGSDYQYSRRSFFVCEEEIPLKRAAAGSSAKEMESGDVGSAQHSGESDVDEAEMEGCWSDEDTEDPSAPPPSARSAKETKKDGRFFVEGGIRAPKLPKRLQETVEAEEMEKKRRREEEQPANSSFK